MMDKKYRILFIGNSYTYFNEMPTELFSVIAKEAGYSVEVESVVKGGWTLEKHSDPESETGSVVSSLLSGDAYDYVILQEQSLRPALNSASFYSAVRTLVSRIRDTGARPLLYSTWGRKAGSPKLTEHGLTNESMTYSLARAYRDIGRELDTVVAYVGLAFYDVGDKVELYNGDMSHPSREGSYLAALTLFLSVFGDTEHLSDCGISPNTTTILKQAAKKAAFEIHES